MRNIELKPSLLFASYKILAFENRVPYISHIIKTTLMFCGVDTELHIYRLTYSNLGFGFFI
jgi:hypothetical protein